MSSLQRRIGAARAQGRAALVGYLPVGYPDVPGSIEAMEAFALLCRTEGIIPAIESAHALAGAITLGKELGSDALLLVNLSGRGDKDVETASRWFGLGDRTEVDPGPGMDTEQRPTEGAVASGDAVPGRAGGESA